jgi:hypothetical protein
MLRVRLWLPGDPDQLNSRLRVADLQEIQAVSREDSLTILKQSAAWSDPCFTIIDQKDIPIAIFGVVPDPLTVALGRIWLLGSNDIVHNSATFLRHSRQWIEKLHERYPTLWNYVDARNEVHIRWLKWCGFTFLRRIEEYGVERRPFYEFERVAGVTPAPPSKSDD